MNPTNIDWCTHTWNPAYGCLRGCVYCYARKLHNKRKSAKLTGAKLPEFYREPFSKIQYFPERLHIPVKSDVIKTVFVGSMSDIAYWEFGFLETVIKVCETRPYKFMFLTKDPSVYTKHIFPKNCWLGTTLTGENSGKRWPNDIKNMEKLQHFFGINNKKFISIEPLLGDFIGHSFDSFDMLIVGAMTGKNAIKPLKYWIESIEHPNIHYKKNIQKYL